MPGREQVLPASRIDNYSKNSVPFLSEEKIIHASHWRSVGSRALSGREKLRGEEKYRVETGKAD
jgi:hypothetical protein